MSGAETTTGGAAADAEADKDRKAEDQSLRFTPLSSRGPRAWSLKSGLFGELARSRLVPVPRPQS
jgi:hypothetical protein